MRILIAPDKFKGSLSARQVAENIALGIRDIIPDAQIEIAPVADGGEGTAEVICKARGGEWVTCHAHGPLGNPIEARYVWLSENDSAVIEMSEAAGLRALKDGVRDVLRANTFGVGEMLLDGAKRGAREIIVGVGGSVTNDGGFGMARALGFRFFTAEPELEILERALTRLADTVTRELDCDFRNNPGAGAAGGLGFGLMSFCRGELRPGFDIVADAVELEEKIRSSDVVITGEGKLDRQTLEGKAPAGVALLARKFGKRIFAVVGRAAPDRHVRDTFDGVYELGGSIPQARELLRERARELGSTLKR